MRLPFINMMGAFIIGDDHDGVTITRLVSAFEEEAQLHAILFDSGVLFLITIVGEANTRVGTAFYDEGFRREFILQLLERINVRPSGVFL